jgi:lipoprotein-anchoring transpeptidase ErfK/SrfK
LGAAIAAVSLAASAACSHHAQASDHSRPPRPVVGASLTPAGSVTITPGDGVTDAPARDPLAVAATNATLDSVTVADGGGGQVAGEFTADKRGWRSTEPLKYGTRYTATVTGTDAGGKQISQTSTFTTVRPVNLTMPYLQANANLALSDRSTYGVGQPIVVHFDEKIADRAAAEKSLEVITQPHVAGAWHWFTDLEVHWRPMDYWTTGTKVTVTAHVYGVNLGGGLYGQQDRSASFTIGDKHVAIADDNTHHIQVFVNDKLDRTVATSMGKHETIRGAHGEQFDLRTRSGVHIVLDTEPKTHMTGASWGLGDNSYALDVNYTTHLSYQGEYLHAAEWNTDKHGKQDDSHGCLNLGDADAKWFMNTFIPGDVVEVKNTGIQLDNMDGLTDWNMSWQQWLDGSALGQN